MTGKRKADYAKNKNMPLVPALLFVALAQSAIPVDRVSYREGSFSVVMPRPCERALNDRLPTFIAYTNDHLYQVGSRKLKPQELKSTQWAAADQERLRKYGLQAHPTDKDVAIMLSDAGAFHGHPCVRQIWRFSGGEQYAILNFTVGQYAIALVCGNREGDNDWTEAQRFFDSFRLEDNVAADPKLAPKPEAEPPMFGSEPGIA